MTGADTTTQWFKSCFVITQGVVTVDEAFITAPPSDRATAAQSVEAHAKGQLILKAAVRANSGQLKLIYPTSFPREQSAWDWIGYSKFDEKEFNSLSDAWKTRTENGNTVFWQRAKGGTLYQLTLTSGATEYVAPRFSSPAPMLGNNFLICQQAGENGTINSFVIYPL